MTRINNMQMENEWRVVRALRISILTDTYINNNDAYFRVESPVTPKRVSAWVGARVCVCVCMFCIIWAYVRERGLLIFERRGRRKIFARKYYIEFRRYWIFNNCLTIVSLLLPPQVYVYFSRTIECLLLFHASANSPTTVDVNAVKDVNELTSRHFHIWFPPKNQPCFRRLEIAARWRN